MTAGSFGERDSGPKQRPLVGWLWHAAAVVSGLLMLLLLRLIQRATGQGEMPIFLFGPIVGVLFVLPLLLYKKGQRHFVASAERVVAGDKRPPVVYVRSFAAERQISEEERALAGILGEVGPFVAIGNPGDRLPPLGASRFYVPGSDWQEFVAGLVRNARFVLMLAGATRGLAWELQLCQHVLNPLQLIILIPRDEQAYEAFRAVARSAEFYLPPYPPLPAWSIPGNILAIVTFEDNWVASLVVRHYGVFDAASRLAEMTASLRLELKDVLGSRGIALAAEEDRFDRLLRRHWRLGFIVLVVLVLWKAIEMLYGAP